MTTHFRYEKCPVCGAVLPFRESHEKALEHLMACAKKLAEGAPEVADVDQLELGCENLAPKNIPDPEC